MDTDNTEDLKNLEQTAVWLKQSEDKLESGLTDAERLLASVLIASLSSKLENLDEVLSIYIATVVSQSLVESEAEAMSERLEASAESDHG